MASLLRPDDGSNVVEEVDIDALIEKRSKKSRKLSGSFATSEGNEDVADSLDALTVHASNTFPTRDRDDSGGAPVLGVKRAQGDEEALIPLSNPDIDDPLLGESTTEEQQRLSDYVNYERRQLMPDPSSSSAPDNSELGYGNDDAFDMDDSHVRLRKRLSLMERMQSKFLAPDERKEKLLPQDTFSLMIIAKSSSLPFFAALCIFTLQVSTFVLVILDLASEGEPSNVFGVPANVPAQLRATQFIAILVAVLTQGDLRTASILLRDGFTKDFDAAFMDTASWKYHLSIFARSISGSVGLMVSFVLIITAPSVVELLLNFTAIEFVSSIDELCFYLSRQGFLGSQCKTCATVVADTMYKVSPESRMGFLRRSWKTVSLFLILIIFLAGWSVIVYYQISGKYLCNTIFVSMGDDFVAALGTFNGLYDQNAYKNGRVQYVERRSKEMDARGRGIVQYCKDLEAWTFRWEEIGDDGNYDPSESDPCEWVARSSATKTYDITTTAELSWLVQDSTKREVVLDPFRLTCFDCDGDGDYCGGKGTCSDAVCTCEEGWYGLQCEFPTPCSRLAVDKRTEDFASTRDWSSDYQTIKLESGWLVEAYHRPIYVYRYAETGHYDVVVFTGRRWALTSSEFLPSSGRFSDEAAASEGFAPTGDEIGNFFHYIFHGYQGYFVDYEVAFLSDYMDTKTDADANSPVGFQWFRAVAAKRTKDHENQKPAGEIDTEFLCRVCDDAVNPCLYDGICVEGTCQCSLDSFGALCEIPPVENGHCDPFFNTPEFKMDGGDCCESTCKNSEVYVCGSEEQGYVSTGYYSCKLPPDEWQDYSLSGPAGSFAGFDLDLSLRSLVVSELLQDRVRVFDKVGSSWALRYTIVGDAGTRFGNRVSVSAGKYNVLSNPSFLAPLTVTVNDGYRVLRVYKCNLDGCELFQEIPQVYISHLSDDGTTLATTVFAENVWPPTLVRVYESVDGGLFLVRSEFTVATPGILYGVFSMAQNGDGNTLVLQKQWITADPELGGLLAKEEIFEVHLWNGTGYEVETGFKYDPGFNTYAYELSLDVSRDGSAMAFAVPQCEAYDFELQVFNRDETNKWVARPPPSMNASLSKCKPSARPKRNNNLKLSKDGSMMAFRLGISVGVYKWNKQEWQNVGDDFPHTQYPVGLSADGKELAIGAPEDGIGGITSVYSLPANKICPGSQSLLRISITLDRLPDEIYWDIRNNHTGEILYQQGPYPLEYAYGTIVEEICVDAETHCFEFSIYNNRNRGLQAPGQYALMLDGDDIGRGIFDGLYEKVTFGNCFSCPEGTEPFEMVMQTCGQLTWFVAKLIDQGANFTLLKNDTTVGPDQNVYESCAIQKYLSGCQKPLQVTWEACLDPNECYAAKVTSPYKQIAFLEVDFGDSKTSGDVTQVCSGSNVFVGNQDECLQEDFGSR